MVDNGHVTWFLLEFFLFMLMIMVYTINDFQKVIEMIQFEFAFHWRFSDTFFSYLVFCIFLLSQRALSATTVWQSAVKCKRLRLKPWEANTARGNLIPFNQDIESDELHIMIIQKIRRGVIILFMTVKPYCIKANDRQLD